MIVPITVILGGAGLGGGTGLLAHYGRTLSEDPHAKVDLVQPVTPIDKSQST